MGKRIVTAALAVFLAAALAPGAQAGLGRIGEGPPLGDEVYYFSTTDLILVYSATSNAWYPLPLQGSEIIRGANFSGRVVVVATSLRILGFSSVTNRWAELAAVPNEILVQVSAQYNVGVVVTSTRSLGFSALTGTWAEENLFYERGGGYP